MAAYAIQVCEFIAAIREARPPSVPATDGLAAVAIVEAVHRTVASGTWQEVEQN
jgi:predicted dehydrogenase